MSDKEKPSEEESRDEVNDLMRRLSGMELPVALVEAGERIEEINLWRRQEQAEWIEKNGPFNAYVKAQAVEVCDIAGHECWIAKSPVWDTLPDYVGYCGYVVFKERPVIEPEWKGVLTYVPVHGGITYAEHDSLGTVYGFDTGHCNSKTEFSRDLTWIKGQLQILIEGVRKAAEVEAAYLKADGDNKHRAEIAQQVIDVQPSESMTFGVMVNLLCGEL